MLSYYRKSATTFFCYQMLSTDTSTYSYNSTCTLAVTLNSYILAVGYVQWPAGTLQSNELLSFHGIANPSFLCNPFEIIPVQPPSADHDYCHILISGSNLVILKNADR